jgi:hypothetical protein
VDAAGRLHIILDSGKETIWKTQGQDLIGDPVISPDRRTIGWTELYDVSEALGHQYDPIPGHLIVYRNGRIPWKFDTEPCLYEWEFRDGGERVAYSTGSLHGGAVYCALRDVESGRIIEEWDAAKGVKPPEWTKGKIRDSLRFPE